MIFSSEWLDFWDNSSWKSADSISLSDGRGGIGKIYGPVQVEKSQSCSISGNAPAFRNFEGGVFDLHIYSIVTVGIFQSKIEIYKYQPLRRSVTNLFRCPHATMSVLLIGWEKTCQCISFASHGAPMTPHETRMEPNRIGTRRYGHPKFRPGVRNGHPRQGNNIT